MWVRGLKPSIIRHARRIRTVAPYVGAWIETVLALLTCYYSLSHPMWVRGLKLVTLIEPTPRSASHPMWVRGLKHLLKSSSGANLVAPYVGAWIETRACQDIHVTAQGRTLCGCVD